jgi:hypothetical protein
MSDSPFIHFLVQDVIELPRPGRVKGLVWTTSKGLDHFRCASPGRSDVDSAGEGT